MNKKVVLSVLSTTLVASVAASAFAAPKDGIYIGGNIKKYYSTDVLFEMTPQAKATYASELNAMASDFNNVVFVDYKGKGASIEELFTKGSKVALGEPLKKEDFADLYKVVNKDGSSTATEDARAKVDPTPTGDLKVESVSAINALTVDVKFGTAVDKSTAENYGPNYSITPVNGSALSIAGAKLQEDGKTVRLTLSTPVTKVATNYTVSVKDVLDTKGNAVAEYSQVISLVDNVRPQVKATSFVDTNTFKVELSEPVDFTNINSAVTVYDGLTPVTVVKTPNTTTKDSFTLSLAGLDSKKEYKLVINSQILDFAGNAISPNPYETVIKPVADTVDPVVDSITPVNLSNFKVKFNEKIKAQAGGQYFSVAIDDANVNPTVTPVADSNDTEFIVKLSGKVTKGLHKVTVKNFQDVAGNPNPASKSTFTKYIDFQDATPAFTTTTGALKTIAGTNYVVFKFANPIASKSISAPVVAQRVADGVTYDTTISNNEFAIKSGVSGLAEDELAINISSLAAGAYALTLPAGAVTDSFGGSNLATKVDFTVGTASAQTQVSPTTEPVTGVAINGDTTGETVDQVIVVFSAEVGDSAKDVANYTVEGQHVFKSAEFYSDKKTVRLTLNDDAIKYDGNYVLGISGVKDKNNKDVKAYSKLIKFAENQKPYIAGAEVNALNTVKVIFNEAVSATAPAALDKEDLNVYVNGSKVSLTSADFSGNTATVKLTDALSSTTAKVEVETSNAFDGHDANKNFGKKGSKLEAVWKVIDNSDNIAAAAAVDTQITNLPPVGSLTLGDKPAVVAARTAYDNLTTAQKALVTKLSTLTAAETKIADLEAAVAADIAAVATDKGALEVVYVTGDSATSVTGDLTLATSGANGTAVTWASSDAAVNATTGVVTRPANGQTDATVTLTATITKGAANDTKTFTVTVKAQ
ncbi:Ig-like domain-containing protein [Brevibacillus brevis]|nr:Ig-like domain-containing protein [Brevibacillus brevis]